MRTRTKRSDALDSDSDNEHDASRTTALAAGSSSSNAFAPASPSSSPSSTRKVVTITSVEGPSVRPAEKQYSLVPRAPKLPGPVQFPLIATLSLSISALLYSLTYQFTRAPLASNERVPEDWTEIAFLTGWKV